MRCGKKSQRYRIIRNFGKTWPSEENALMISECQSSHGFFFSLIASWPNDDIIVYGAYLKKNGARIGGNTGPYTLKPWAKTPFYADKGRWGYLRLHDIIPNRKETRIAWKAGTAVPFNQLDTRKAGTLF